MNDTTHITETAAFVKTHWATISVAAVWLAREVQNFNRWAINAGRTVVAAGGLKNIARKLWKGNTPS